MGAWKKLNQQDAFVTQYNAKKYWRIEENDLTSTDVETYLANTSSILEYYPDSADLDNGEYSSLTYRSINHLYYKQLDNVVGSLLASSSFDNHFESYKTQEARFLGDQALVYSIPRTKFGTHIEPGTLVLDKPFGYVAVGYYIPDGYVYSGLRGIYDNGEGILYWDNRNFALGTDEELVPEGTIVGNVIYSHGIVIITEPGLISYLITEKNREVSIDFKSNLPIYTANYNIKLSDYEYNFTQNPSAISGSDNSLKSNVTGSSFQPYITTVGLYNDVNELIAVGKLSQPLPKSRHTETTIQVKLNI